MTDDGGDPDNPPATAVAPAWRQALPVAALAVLAFVAALVVHHWFYRYGSGDRDEAVYRYQADLLRDGRLSVPVEQFRFYRPWLSDLHDGRLVVPFTLPWVAVLATSGALLGSPVAALGVAAAGLTVGTHLLVRALLGEHRLALLATALVSFSPFVLSQSGTYLNYVLALTLEVFAGWTLVRAVQAAGGHRGVATGAAGGRPTAWRWFAASGLLWATALWCRPLDAVLVGLPFAAWAAVQLRAAPPRAERWRDWSRRLGRPLGALVAGAAPVAVAIGVTNRVATGSATTFPVSAQSGGAARVGWGPRGIFRGELTVDYTPGTAFSALGDNLAALPTWLVGSYLAVAVAVHGARCLWRRDRATTVLLVVLALVCPLGYLGWFAAVLTVPGAFTGIGPHYYLPSVVPLAALAAIGARDLWERQPRLATVGLAVTALLTVGFVAPKVDRRLEEAAHDRHIARTVDRAVDARGGRPALVVLPAAGSTDGVMRYLDRFANRADLTGPVVYALDRGPELFDLLEEQPDRAPFRITRELRPGGGLSRPDPVVQPITVVSGPVVEVHVAITSTTADPLVAATIEHGDRVVSVPLAGRSEPGLRHDVTWRLHADGRVEVVVDGTAREVDLALTELGEVGFGTASGTAASELTAPDPGRDVRTFPFRRDPRAGTVEVSTAGADTVDFGGPDGAVLPIDVSDRLAVEFRSP